MEGMRRHSQAVTVVERKSAVWEDSTIVRRTEFVIRWTSLPTSLSVVLTSPVLVLATWDKASILRSRATKSLNIWLRALEGSVCWIWSNSRCKASTSSSGLKFLITDSWGVFIDEAPCSESVAWGSGSELLSAFGKAALLQRSLAALAAREVASFLSANEASPAFELKELRPVLMLFRSPLFLGPDLSSF